jgi:hypothetical protein
MLEMGSTASTAASSNRVSELLDSVSVSRARKFMSRTSSEQFARLGASVGATEVGWRACQALKQSLTCQVIEGISGAESLSWQTAVHNEKKIRIQTPLNQRRNGRRPEGRTNELSAFWAFSMRTIIDVLLLSTNTFSSSTSAEELREITDN